MKKKKHFLLNKKKDFEESWLYALMSSLICCFL